MSLTIRKHILDFGIKPISATKVITIYFIVLHFSSLNFVSEFRKNNVWLSDDISSFLGQMRSINYSKKVNCIKEFKYMYAVTIICIRIKLSCEILFQEKFKLDFRHSLFLF